MGSVKHKPPIHSHIQSICVCFAFYDLFIIMWVGVYGCVMIYNILRVVITKINNLFRFSRLNNTVAFIVHYKCTNVYIHHNRIWYYSIVVLPLLELCTSAVVLCCVLTVFALLIVNCVILRKQLVFKYSIVTYTEF